MPGTPSLQSVAGRGCAAGSPGLPAVAEVSVHRPSVRERVERVELSLFGGEKIRLWAHEFRMALGFDQLKSTMFFYSKEEDQFQFSGQGFGHGVGLCQWGSRALGKQGRNYLEILEHYYPRAQVRGSLPIANVGSIRNSQKVESQIK